MNLKDYIKNVPNFPEEGIQFKDITPLIGDPEAFRYAVNQFADFAKAQGATKVVGPDARGFIFGAPVAVQMGLGFIPVRKPGKLPRETLTEKYSLEYGENSLSIHKDDLQKGDKVVILDDLLATGGTIKATIKLIEQTGAEVVGVGFLIELDALEGRRLFEGYDIISLMHY